ncbi:MAG: methyltransferase domain-containing protein [Melioribacteraceae bacterium]|nr:methyltransferase domain-containing protein [Melioribacteraceae bacterium]
MNLFEDLMLKAGIQFSKKDFGKSLILLLASEVINNEEGEADKKGENNLRIENMKGHCLVALEDYDSAKQAFENILLQKENIAEVHAGLGMLYWNLGEANKSLEHFSRSFEINPFNRPGVIYYSKVLHSIGKVDQAKLFCLDYFKMNPADLEILNLLLEISDVETLKQKRLDVELVLVTGVHGSGKTTYANKISNAVLHIDQFFDYSQNRLNYDSLKMVKDYQTYFLNNKNIVLDGYVMFIDPQFEKLREVIAPVEKIIVKYNYTSPEELYNSQRSNEERRANMAKEELSKEEDILWNKKEQIILLQKFEKLLEVNAISGIDFVYRMGNTYIDSTKEHFLETMGEITDWSMNKFELISFVRKNESQPYQTIEYKGEIIRPGTEQCWLSWENIEKFKIDWKDKYVCDIGSYFGYFSLQAFKNGAGKVLGIDQNEDLLKVYREVLLANGYSNFRTLSIKLGNGNNIQSDNYDIIMVLNMLHHIERSTTTFHYNNVLESIFRNAKEVVMEINDYQIQNIEEISKLHGFQLIDTIKSHRNTSFGQRFLLYFSKI